MNKSSRLSWYPNRAQTWVAGLLAMLGLVSLAQAGDSSVVGMTTYDGVVEAERQTVIAPQVSGVIEAIAIHAGDRVKAGQVMVRLDAQAAGQVAAASTAQVAALQAELTVAQQDVARQQQLFAQGYISQAAFDRAQARFQTTQAETRAQLAQASASKTQAGYYVIRAPYNGRVADVPANVGDMAQPGHPLLTYYDPAHLRVTAVLPQSVVLKDASTAAQLDLGGIDQRVKPSYVTILPTADPVSHTVKVYFGLNGANLPVPGTFVRVWLPSHESANPSVMVPLAAVVQRADMNGVYVMDPQGHPQLRLVRLGRTFGNEVEILTGVSPQDHVAPDAQAALTQAH